MRPRARGGDARAARGRGPRDRAAVAGERVYAPALPGRGRSHMAGTRGTALITGASAGLGTEFVWLFAKEGYDVVLVARRREKLEELAKEVAAAHGVAAHAI